MSASTLIASRIKEPASEAFRAEHPEIEINSPADSRTGMWSAYHGGKILVVKSCLRQLLDRLDELLASCGVSELGHWS